LGVDVLGAIPDAEGGRIRRRALCVPGVGGSQAEDGDRGDGADARGRDIRVEQDEVDGEVAAAEAQHGLVHAAAGQLVAEGEAALGGQPGEGRRAGDGFAGKERPGGGGAVGVFVMGPGHGVHGQDQDLAPGALGHAEHGAHEALVEARAPADREDGRFLAVQSAAGRGAPGRLRGSG